MKAIISIILSAVILGLAWLLISIFTVSIEFEEVRLERESVVVENLKDIRSIQRMYRTKYNKFAPTFDELERFYNQDDIELVMAIGSEDDSVAVATGRIARIITKVPVKDTVFNHRGADFDIAQLRFVPFSAEATGSKVQFDLAAVDSLKTRSDMFVPVFEASVRYNDFLGDLNEQELINYRDIRVNTLKRFDGLRVGSIESANNEAGNWEE